MTVNFWVTKNYKTFYFSGSKCAAHDRGDLWFPLQCVFEELIWISFFFSFLFYSYLYSYTIKICSLVCLVHCPWGFQKAQTWDWAELYLYAYLFIFALVGRLRNSMPYRFFEFFWIIFTAHFFSCFGQHIASEAVKVKVIQWSKANCEFACHNSWFPTRNYWTKASPLCPNGFILKQN